MSETYKSRRPSFQIKIDIIYKIMDSNSCNKLVDLTDFGITKLALTSRQYDKLLGTYIVSLDFGSP
jgi:hypothetical protein